ncbi:uncharacterized protein F5Z01DRAFT_618147 [Emericellopsis atlantica]|uniref:Proteasome activator subunit 4 n=1 Tax=Emericellopsis atlantica TaxID=2614577 RepID=A0A9P7ZR39_9HYPO|nr:uncharacterized protein F5Z01DRAFT_618147 [Emericellopsis atlantica]KAG9256789.1 hypothetical protein F5Z01DRAFT_618147 [Emericellopsis atlantica]
MDEHDGPRGEYADMRAPASAVAHLVNDFSTWEPVSRATSPGAAASCANGRSSPTDEDPKRYRPRTFAYFKQLPFDVEAESERDAALEEILKQLYIAVKAEDYSPGAVHWTRELQAWINLKFEMTREQRVTLTKLYYSLTLTPGVATATSDRFARMVSSLTRKTHYLKPVEDLILDWRPLWEEVKPTLFQSEAGTQQAALRKTGKTLMKLCYQACTYFDPQERRAMLDEFLPFFSTNELSNAYIVFSLLMTLLPSSPAPEENRECQPAEIFPTIFHLWSLVNRSKSFDAMSIDLFSRFARDHLHCEHVPFGRHGIFTKEQSDVLFSAVLRLTGIPVGQAGSPYSTLDYLAGAAMYLEKDRKKYPIAHSMARLIVMSLSPQCLDGEDSAMASLEGLLDSIETFFHPSNQGGWTTFLGQLTLYLSQSFLSRWNSEQNGESSTPDDRRINEPLKKRFVTSLKEVTFMGLFSKSSKVAVYYYDTLQNLAFLEPDIILPGALQRFYPSLQGLVEVHRTTSSLNGLQMIANVMSRTKGYRCHLTALMALALPGIDANDLHKTQITLAFLQSVAYSIPMSSLTRPDDHIHGTDLAMQWVQGEMERFEREGQNVQVDYETELSDEDEANILRSSTAGFGEFLVTLLGKVFTLLENLPDANQSRGGTPEDSVINALPAALSPIFSSLSPELFDLTLEKLAAFVSSHVIHQARDAMAWTVNVLCKVNPEKCLKVFIPMLIVNIRNEIDQNHAASDRTTGTDYLPRDRALVWHVSMLGMVVVHVGREVLTYKNDLIEIAKYMQANCRGLPTMVVWNFIHHLLLNLTTVYSIDHALYEPEDVARGLDIGDWGRTTSPADLTIKWHQPSPPEIELAVELFESQTRAATEQMNLLMSDNPPVSRTGRNKEWSDEVSRIMQQIRLNISGMAALFDPRRAATDSEDIEMNQATDDVDTVDDDPLAEVAEDEELRPQFYYKAGYALKPNDEVYKKIHGLREDIGNLLSQTHAFLCQHQEDDVASFTSLYSAYRNWITDVGIERSARPLDRHWRIYKADISPFRIKGLRKAYPRPLLIKRAEAYQLMRMKHNATTRHKSELDKRLLLDLAESSLSLYADVRRTAQGAQDASLRVLIGGRPIVIPVLIEAFRKALRDVDHDRIKGAMYTLLHTSLLRTVVKDWRFAPDVMRLFIESASIDKESIQKLGSGSVYNLISFGRPFERLIVLDEAVLDTIKPTEDVASIISRRHNFIMQRRAQVEDAKADLGLELTRKAKSAHWKIAGRCALFATNLCCRFNTIAPSEFVDLVAEGTNDTHPTLRSHHLQAFTSVFTIIDMRAAYGHDYRNYLLGKEVNEQQMLKVKVEKGDEAFTQRYLEAFSHPEGAEYMVDCDYPGWLVWGDEFTAAKAKPAPFECYDDTENAVRDQIGKILNKQWFSKFFAYLKQEPKDSTYDRYRLSNVWLLTHCFDLANYGKTAATVEEIQELTKELYGDGSDKHEHRAASEILGAMLTGSCDDPPEMRNRVWNFAAPMLLKIISEQLTPENVTYWLTSLHVLLESRDPRRCHEIFDALKSFRLDMTSNAAFKESAKIQLLEFATNDGGWRLQGMEPNLQDFLAHLDHPYKAVREAMGRVIATIYKTRYHESFPNVTELVRKNRESSSIGLRPYKPTQKFTETITGVFQQLEQWRHERAPGQQTPSSYTSASKTVLMWLDCTLQSQECIQLAEFFPEPFMEQLLHMMDVKEDPELMRTAYHVYRHLPNIPLRDGEDVKFIDAMVRIGRTASSWHQRLRVLVNMQVIYFRRIFLTHRDQRDKLFTAVSDMLSDSQIEVRTSAASTLAGMIRCSPRVIRDAKITELKDRFEEELRRNPMPKRRAPGTETPVNHNQQVTRRHAAVLGLGALIEAFPYATPPPEWMPEVLALLARRAAGDPGTVGKATKTILSEFKKTRQDSWTVDQKYFTSEQLEDLEGVLWKSYFA